MSEQVHAITDLAKPRSGFKTFAKRSALAAVAVTVVAAIALKVMNKDDETVDVQTTATA